MHDGLHRLVVGVQGQEVGGWLGSVSAQPMGVVSSGIVANGEDGSEEPVAVGGSEGSSVT
eukprot:9473503-Pyramimonas_sp.AAC.1